MHEIDFALADAIGAYQNDGKFNIEAIPNQAIFLSQMIPQRYDLYMLCTWWKRTLKSTRKRA